MLMAFVLVIVWTPSRVSYFLVGVIALKNHLSIVSIQLTFNSDCTVHTLELYCYHVRS
jgi:hypothetical protein